MSKSIDRQAVLLSTIAAAAASTTPRWALAHSSLKGTPIAPVRPVTETLWS